MYRTIVIGHDGTVAADAALRFAERLAAEDARLVLTRVAPASRRADAEAELAARAASARGPLPRRAWSRRARPSAASSPLPRMRMPI